MKNFICLAIITGLWSCSTLAGVTEIGIQGNYKTTNFDPQHTDVMESGTVSIGYYFWELTAVEASYTRGQALQSYSEYSAYQDLTGYGLDLMVTLANKETAFKPYVKLGTAYIIKDLREMFSKSLPAVTVESQGLAPSAGIGFKYMMSQQFALKAGFDISTSPIFFYTTTSPDPNTVTYDISANAGMSVLF